jgi:hypothetical protein
VLCCNLQLDIGCYTLLTSAAASWLLWLWLLLLLLGVAVGAAGLLLAGQALCCSQ